ncbi:MAG TPA: putative glycolipid-binding domain-containing protein [Polyangiaceae bacterium]|nr:putative glycolipid-binding domain-containing protein [Polyangiaceae bacterium]
MPAPDPSQRLRALVHSRPAFVPEASEAGSPGASILWRRLDRPGHDSARLSPAEGGWLLSGAAAFAEGAEACRLDYLVACDAGFRTLGARVSGWVGARVVDVVIEAGDGGRWRLGGLECPAVAGCVDVDISFSPSTNLLPIRRLGLAVGAEAEVRAAWLRFPEVGLEPLAQRYRRIAPDRYRYESDGGRFVRELRVDGAGFVADYPGLWARVA